MPLLLLLPLFALLLPIVIFIAIDVAISILANFIRNVHIGYSLSFSGSLWPVAGTKLSINKQKY